MMFKVGIFLIALPLIVGAISISYLPETRNPPTGRQSSGFTLDKFDSKLYIYGGISVNLFSDLWEFDLITNKWTEIHSPSVLKPGPRSGSFLTRLKGQRKLLLLGGDTSNGPISDIWLYDIDYQTVALIQWKLVDDKGTSPPRGYYKSVTEFVHDNKDYIAIYGGATEKGFSTRLFLLDLETFTWLELPSLGDTPNTNLQQMKYYNRYLYIWGDMNTNRKPPLYQYEFDTGIWNRVQPSGEETGFAFKYALCIYNNQLYSVLGAFEPSQSVIKIDLTSKSYNLERNWIDTTDMGDTGMAYYCDENLIYMFGGNASNEDHNSLTVLDFDKYPLQFKFLSKDMKLPSARRGHAMQVYDDKLYIYGGASDSGSNVIDMWSFDLEKEVWSSVIIKSTIIPEPRSDFAHGKIEENLLMFGGIGDSELLNDLYLFNLRNNEWQLIDIKSKDKPSPRKGSCLASTNSVTYIYGGIVSSGYNNELWKFDWSTNKYELLTPSGFTPPGLAYAKCSITYNSNNDDIFEIYLGEYGKFPVYELYQLNTKSNEWTSIQVSNPLINLRAKAASIKLGDKIIIVGGHFVNFWVRNEVLIIDTTLKTIQVSYLDTPIFSAASVYYKDKIYIHGGGGSYGHLALEDIIKRDLIVIDLNEDCEEPPYACISSCSKGSHTQSGKCRECPEGTYSDVFGIDTCKLCPAGHYSDIKGADSPRVCKRCPDGFFSDLEGQPRCKKCQGDFECSSVTGIPDYSQYSTVEYESQQPELYNEETYTNQTGSLYFNASISLTFILGVAIISYFKKRSSWIKKFDMYSLQHNYEENKPMYIRRTVIGGMFSLGFICLAISIIFSTSLSYGLNNIVEIKSLVPIITLEHEYGKFISETSLFEFKFSEYGGKCTSTQDDTCTEFLNISFDNVNGELVDLKCRVIDSDCYLNFGINNFEITSLGSVNVELYEFDSYCYDISVKVQTSSSIPGELSSISTTISKDANKYYRGSEGSIVNLLMTPSLFISETDELASELKGYHISQIQDPIKGSQISYTDISFVNSLKVNISMTKNDSVLLTKRLKKQDLVLYLSNLAGSIIGVMGMVGFFMNLTEEKYEKYKRNRVVKRSFEFLENNRRMLVDMNFLSLECDSKPILISKPFDYDLELEEFAIPAENITELFSNQGSSKRNSMVLVKV